MATTKKEMIIIAKYTVKANGAVIYRMRSNIPNKVGRIEGCDQVERNGEWFDVYMVSSDGEYVCGCETSGETCKGSKYRGTCCHRKYAQMLLDLANAARKAVIPVVAIKRLEDLGQRGNLNGSVQTSQMPAWLAILPSRQHVASYA